MPISYIKLLKWCNMYTYVQVHVWSCMHAKSCQCICTTAGFWHVTHPGFWGRCCPCSHERCWESQRSGGENLQVCGNHQKHVFFFFKQSASHRIFGISNVNPHERLLLLEMQLQMCSIQVCCLKPSEQTVQIDMQTFQTRSATMIISLQGRDWIGLPPDENREHLHRPGTSNHFELVPYVCLRKGREFRRLRESWSETWRLTRQSKNIRRDSPRTGDDLQIFTGSIDFNASLLQEAWTFAPQIDMRVIRDILRYPQRSGSRTGISFAMSLPRFVICPSCFIIFSPFDVHVWWFLYIFVLCCSWTTDRRRPATWQSSSTWGERSNLQGVTQLMRSGDDWQWKNPAELPFRLN